MAKFSDTGETSPTQTSQWGVDQTPFGGRPSSLPPIQQSQNCDVDSISIGFKTVILPAAQTCLPDFVMQFPAPGNHLFFAGLNAAIGLNWYFHLTPQNKDVTFTPAAETGNEAWINLNGVVGGRLKFAKPITRFFITVAAGAGPIVPVPTTFGLSSDIDFFAI